MNQHDRYLINLMCLSEKKFSSKKDVLVAENKLYIQPLYRFQLYRFNLTFDLVDNGKKVLEALKATNYKIILLNPCLPDIDGKSVCQKIRKDCALRHNNTPILIFSDSANSTKQEYLDAGANCFYAHSVVGMNDFNIILNNYLCHE